LASLFGLDKTIDKFFLLASLFLVLKKLLMKSMYWKFVRSLEKTIITWVIHRLPASIAQLKLTITKPYQLWNMKRFQMPSFHSKG
jgi:hypothetical protein